jgi:hypothetical protein
MGVSRVVQIGAQTAGDSWGRCLEHWIENCSVDEPHHKLGFPALQAPHLHRAWACGVTAEKTLLEKRILLRCNPPSPVTSTHAEC